MTRIIRKIEPLAPKVPAKKRVAAYARVSSGKDAMLHSLSAQISYYSDYIQKHKGWEYVGVYADEATTGTKDGRAEFQRLLTDCRNGKIDMVVTKSISRFARNTVTMLETVRELKSLNVDVFFEKENIYSMSGDGELMLTILASFAQEESRSVSENCKWRIKNRFKHGELANLQFIYGYNIRKGSIKINPKEAEVVKMIFNDYVAGIGTYTIAKKLRQMGIPRPWGGEWKPVRVLEILKNEKYAGNALLQKQYVIDHLSKKEVPNRGELPMYYAEGTHPAIIDLESFQYVQNLIHDKHCKNNISNDPQAKYPLTGKITCMNCGKKYYRRSGRARVSWQCTTFLHLGKTFCNAKQIPEETLFSTIADVLGIMEFEPALFEKLIKEIQVIGPNQLRFIFNDGHIESRIWKDRSRKESWDSEARQRARERQKEYMERRMAECV